MSFIKINKSDKWAKLPIDAATRSRGNTQMMSVLPFVKQLCNRLKKANINYCYWKSNAALDRSASGDNDLDLLVSRADVQRFTTTLYGMRCKQANPPDFMKAPGILDFYAYDNKHSGQMVHVLDQLKLMDAPQIERLVASQYHRTWLINWLVGLEKRWFQEIVSPRMLIVLKGQTVS